MGDVRSDWEAAVLASDLSDSLKITAWAIRKFANIRGDCFPSQRTLATTRRCSVKTIRRHLMRLEEFGWIERHKGLGKKGLGGTTDLIEIAIPERGDSRSVPSSTVERPDNMDFPPSDAAETKEGTNPIQRGDTESERRDKSGLKSGHLGCPLNQKPSLNRRTSASLRDARMEDDMPAHLCEPRRWPDPPQNRVRQDVIDAVRYFGCRDSKSLVLLAYVQRSVKDAQRGEIEAAVRKLVEAREL